MARTTPTQPLRGYNIPIRKGVSHHGVDVKNDIVYYTYNQRVETLSMYSDSDSDDDWDPCYDGPRYTHHYEVDNSVDDRPCWTQGQPCYYCGHNGCWGYCMMDSDSDDEDEWWHSLYEDSIFVDIEKDEAEVLGTTASFVEIAKGSRPRYRKKPPHFLVKIAQKQLRVARQSRMRIKKVRSDKKENRKAVTLEAE